ncbi:LytTR family DNA-binding domain-containing protein [Pedobacter sp. ASV28]|uniref:LytR/AlgR family response regulator transcription factor n=1 Tax=Pedobacter sp. ASV28 TaxID=2795123 RepID=UPI0018EB925D|nr:LytTR family DNA-binding domain-containing protein [Pedobacter sp. ASV28]
MNLKCVVIDDDDFAIDSMVDYISEMPGLGIYRTFNNPTLALNEIRVGDEIDFIFLDIEMPGISGLELAAQLRDKTRYLIFTTSHSGYALKAFNLNIDQYLLKPFSFADFAFKINYLLKNSTELSSKIQLAQEPPSGQEQYFIKADSKNSYHQIDPDEIIYVEAAKNYVVVYTVSENFITLMGLSEMERSLDQSKFIRISKSFIVAKKAIKKIEGNSIRVANNKTLQLGEKYRPKFLDFLKQNLLNK